MASHKASQVEKILAAKTPSLRSVISTLNVESVHDSLKDTLGFPGGSQLVEDEVIKYGDLQLTVAAKAITLLADQLFSPALLLAERVERGLLSAPGLSVLELGAGCALPSLLLSTLGTPPTTIVVTDYPDPDILENLVRNVQRNKSMVVPGCTLYSCGYEWGADVAPLLWEFGIEGRGYDVVILSDLLHFHGSHTALISSVNALLSHSQEARIHVAAGNYTKREVCDNFLRLSEEAGLEFDEILPSEGEHEWLGRSLVSGIDEMALKTRKAACRYWVGQRAVAA
ncbi:hypothetical protein DFH06DRAFT_1274557 [Mycena polygramma]|nr:hypothetical protein DFH06DRAFT_1274557 [Mycena polygramma]